MKLEQSTCYKENGLPPKLMVQMDNASDNKAKVVMAFAAQLVEAGIFEEIELNFLIVGHTHEDIDQYFSVISRYFKHLVYNFEVSTVFTYEDFQRAVMDAFKQEHKPKCIERVALNHDFVAWLTPFRDSNLAGITNFRHFHFRKLNEDDSFPEYLGKAVLFAKEYMTSPDSKYRPNAKDMDAHGPCVIFRNAVVTGSPDWEPFRDISQSSKRDGAPSLPRAFIGKSSSEILQLKKDEWLSWVCNPFNGATSLQKQQFRGLMDIMVATVAELPEAVLALQPKWDLPVPRLLREANMNDEERVSLPDVNIMPPSPQIAYGNLSYRVATAPVREHARMVIVQEEIIASGTTLAAIKKDDVLLIKNIPVDGGGEGVCVEWWLGVAQKTHVEMERASALEEKVSVQWMHPRGATGPNDLNAKFVPWVLQRQGNKGPKNKKNIEDVDRVAIVMIGVGLTNNGSIRKTSKKAISDLQIGFVFEAQNKMLMFTGA